MARTEPAPWAVVKRDQCRGIDLCCVNCEVVWGGVHKVGCYSAAIAKQAYERRP